MNRRAGAPEVQSVTGVRRSLTDDLDSRMHKYLISMTIRTICFVLAVVFQGWLRWVFASAAMVLPYVAVLIANAGREPNPQGPAAYVPDLPALSDQPHVQAPPAAVPPAEAPDQPKP